MSRPTQAVILAGGRGTRLLPLTKTVPKAMIRFHGKPFLEYLIEQLREQGFTRALLLLGYLPNVIIDYFGDGSRFGIDIEYNVTSVDDETGKRLRLALPKIDQISFFLYCDNYVPFSFDRLWQIFCREKVPALLTVYNNDDNYTKSNLRIDEKGRVVIYDKTRTAENLQGVDIGYMIFERSILDMIPDENISFEKSVYPRLVEERKLHAFVTRHRYYSVGDHERLQLTEAFLAREPAVLIDRDGVLNKKALTTRYIRSWDEWEWLDGAKEALRLFRNAGYKTIVITNQAGIARKAMTLNDLEEIHERIKSEVEEAGGHIDAIYFCPHDWDEGCFCRKPAPGMLFAAQRDFHLDLSRAVFIGDDERDGMAAEAVEMPWIKVTKERSMYDIALEMTGRGKTT